MDQTTDQEVTSLDIAQAQGHVTIAAVLEASLNARANAHAGHASLFRDAAEAGAFPAPLAQWGPSLAPAARAELSAWAHARFVDERACFTAFYRGPRAACRPFEGYVAAMTCGAFCSAF